MFPFEYALRRFQEIEEQIKRFGQVELPIEDEDEEDEEEEILTLYDYFTHHDCWYELTGLDKHAVDSLWNLFDAAMQSRSHRRGPKLQSSPMDHLLTYLTWLRTGLQMNQLAPILNMSERRVGDNLHRARPILLRVLQEKWWLNRPRPVFNHTSCSPAVGLIIGAHTTTIPRPSEDEEVFWDGKNGKYGLKHEVAVSPSPPHYCLFVSLAYPASVSDYGLHKEHYHNYLKYLLMTPNERVARPEGFKQHDKSLQQEYWQTMADEGCMGNAIDTSPLSRITPFSGILDEEKIEFNNALNKERLVVDCLFKTESPILHFIYYMVLFSINTITLDVKENLSYQGSRFSTGNTERSA